MNTRMAKGPLPSRAKFLIALGLAGSLLAASFGAALAAPDEKEAKHGFFGTVSAKAESSFTIEKKKGDVVELKVTDETRFRTAGDADIDLGDIPLGRRVAVLAQGETESATALKVMLIPQRPTVEHKVVAVTEVRSKKIIGRDLKGNHVEIDAEGDVSGDLKGRMVTVVLARADERAQARAKATVKLDEVVARLEAHAGKLTAEAKAEGRAAARADKDQSIADIRARIRAHIEAHETLFAEIIEKAPEQARPHLEHALDVSVQGMERALVALGEPKAEAEARVKLETANGVVSSVDAEKGMVKVKTDARGEIEIKVDSKTEIRIDGREGDLQDIKTGNRVTVRYEQDSKVAAMVHVKAAVEAEGSVESVDVLAGTISIKTVDGELRTFKITGDTRFDIEGSAGGLAAIALGTKVEIKYDAETNVAAEIESEDEVGARAVGTAASGVDRGGNLMVNLDGGGSITIKVTGETEVVVDGETKSAAEIESGDRVMVDYEAGSKIATEIKVKGRGKSSAPAPKSDSGASGTADIKVGISVP
ncbi:MAG: hypothetical protein HY682_03250 [Chloroflexi bacterium]|nr:hypothetical protein [Chloroflexota bacterium]